jgi:hypothetical protein
MILIMIIVDVINNFFWVDRKFSVDATYSESSNENSSKLMIWVCVIKFTYDNDDKFFLVDVDT